jgi:hypothetical protein
MTRFGGQLDASIKDVLDAFPVEKLRGDRLVDVQVVL